MNEELIDYIEETGLETGSFNSTNEEFVEITFQ